MNLSLGGKNATPNGPKQRGIKYDPSWCLGLGLIKLDILGSGPTNHIVARRKQQTLIPPLCSYFLLPVFVYPRQLWRRTEIRKRKTVRHQWTSVHPMRPHQLMYPKVLLIYCLSNLSFCFCLFVYEPIQKFLLFSFSSFIYKILKIDVVFVDMDTTEGLSTTQPVTASIRSARFMALFNCVYEYIKPTVLIDSFINMIACLDFIMLSLLWNYDIFTFVRIIFLEFWLHLHLL